MRIMIVTDQYPPMVGGVPNVAHGLAVDFTQRGHQVWVVAPSYGTRDVQRTEEGVQVSRFSSFEWPTYKDLRIPLLPFGPIHKLLKQSDPDVIHVHSPIVLGNIAHILAPGLHKPLIATNHYLPNNMLSRSVLTDPVLGKPLSALIYSYLVYFYNRCDYVTSPTRTALDLLSDHGLHAPSKVISNGIDLKSYTPGAKDSEVIRRLGLPEDRPLIIHVNRLSEEKRIDVLLDAMARLRTPAHLALTSTGPAEAALRAQVEQLKIQDRVSFLGFVRDEDLIPLRRSAQLFVIPSEADLQSLAMMEAMACGLPSVAANSYALPELVHHNQNGFLFEPGNSDEMAAYMDRILQDPELQQSMGTESLNIIAAHDKDNVLDQWEELYTQLATEFAEAQRLRQRAHASSIAP
ncbi:glycosyltransferase [Dictyobacter aurantiacus]|uniref:Glycosyl transferase n=1 Tax=Dictyobacter aurantiacus TaxID=1936993 RepID=A0A401ZN79_9CHLR|nr:glycosyltransferase [Dictyobacter aurantiacus]GCE08348.1 glycosyl transferase [Dictyobacter aurantiacus]